MATPDGIAVESTRSRSIRSAPSSKKLLPLPSTTGWTQSRYSSIRSCPIRVFVSSPEPYTIRPLPGCSLSLATASGTSPSITWVFCQSGSSSVVDATYFAMPFIRSGNSPDRDGQTAAKNSYDLRPRIRPSLRLSRSTLRLTKSSSSPGIHQSKRRRLSRPVSRCSTRSVSSSRAPSVWAADSTPMGGYYHTQMAMTGENRLLETRQPGGRRPAPGELALVQAFINTRWDLTTEGNREILVSSGALRDWLQARGLVGGSKRLTSRDLDRVLAVREGLRALAFANNDHRLDPGAIEAMRQASAGVGTEIHIDPEGPRFVADTTAGIDGAIGALFAITARAMIDGTWRRVKACPGR